MHGDPLTRLEELDQMGGQSHIHRRFGELMRHAVGVPQNGGVVVQADGRAQPGRHFERGQRQWPLPRTPTSLNG